MAKLNFGFLTIDRRSGHVISLLKLKRMSAIDPSASSCTMQTFSGSTQMPKKRTMFGWRRLLTETQKAIVLTPVVSYDSPTDVDVTSYVR